MGYAILFTTAIQDLASTSTDASVKSLIAGTTFAFHTRQLQFTTGSPRCFSLLSLSDDKEWQAYLAAEYAEELKKREASAVWKPSAQMRSSTTVIKVTDMKVLTTHHNTLHPPHAHSQPHPCVTVIIDSPSRDVNRLNLSLTSDLKAILQVVSQRRHPQPLHKAL